MQTNIKNVLLFGANGQLGYELKYAIKKSLRTQVLISDRSRSDFKSPESLRKIIRYENPEIIINAAAYTDVDGAETDSVNATKINADAPSIMSEEAQSCGAVFVHYSTDYVFDGKKKFPYREIDVPKPQSVYGLSKLAGEKAVAGNCEKYLIFRTSWVFGSHGRNFLKTILHLAGKQNDLRIVEDQQGTPTSTALIAEITVKILMVLNQATPADGRWGLYHLTASGETNWCEYARYIIKKANLLDYPLKVTPVNVKAIATNEYQTAALRPANSCLNTVKLRKTFKLQIPDWKEGVDQVLEEIAVQRIDKGHADKA